MYFFLISHNGIYTNEQVIFLLKAYNRHPLKVHFNWLEVPSFLGNLVLQTYFYGMPTKDANTKLSEQYGNFRGFPRSSQSYVVDHLDPLSEGEVCDSMQSYIPRRIFLTLASRYLIMI